MFYVFFEGVVAERCKRLFAEETVTAGDQEWIDDAIAHLNSLDFAANFNNFSHKFMPDNVAATFFLDKNGQP